LGTSTDNTAASIAQNEEAPQANSSAQSIDAPLAGNVFKVMVRHGDNVQEGDVVMILEAMKMETEIRSAFKGTVTAVMVGEGDAVSSGQSLITLG
jgi:oxaloacetate decarboxylase alpha subunit